MSNPTCQPEIIKKVNNWFNIIQDYLLPPTCLLCSAPGFQSRDLCRACHLTLPKNTLSCYQCGGSFDSPSDIPHLCGMCLKQRPAYDETYAPFIYQGSIRYLIYTLKYQTKIKNARLLGTLLADHLATTAVMPDFIIPVPLHRSRYRERGFNQSTAIAANVAKQLRVPLNLSYCQRNRNTPHQTNLDAKLRRKNLRNAFTVNTPETAHHVAIVDDVMTTGSTVNELAKTLKKSGVNRVDIWVCARVKK